MSLVEIVFAVSIAAAGILASTMLLATGQSQIVQTREHEIARLAITNVKEALGVVRIRAKSGTDTSQWLFSATRSFEISRNQDGTPFKLTDAPGASNPKTMTLKRLGTSTGPRCVVIDFPVWGLVGAPDATSPATTPFPAGRPHAGRLAFYVDEQTMPRMPAPPAVSSDFPFCPTWKGPGATTYLGTAPNLELDCDGDGIGSGASATADLRLKDDTTTNPCRLIPVLIEVRWMSAGAGRGTGTTGRIPIEREREFVLLNYRGFDTN